MRISIRYTMITILGVGHVFDISKQVKYIIRQANPQAVCIELDPIRYHALRNPQEKKDRSEGGATYELMAAFQNKVADDYGGEAGAEMLAAADAAAEIGAKLCLIDVDARALFERIMSEMTFREKAKLFFASFGSIFVRKKTIEEEISNYEEDTEKYMEIMGQQLPTMKRILVDERNDLMTSNILKITADYPDVAVVIGDGHVDGITKMLKEQEVRVVRLKEIRNMVCPEEEDMQLADDNCTLRYSFGR